MEQILLLSIITQYFFVIFLIIQNQNCGTVYANNYDNISICEMDYIHRVSCFQQLWGELCDRNVSDL